MKLLKKETTTGVVIGPFVDDTDLKTRETGLAGSMSVQLAKVNGTTQAVTNGARNSTGTITHLFDGFYNVPLNGPDTAVAGRLLVSGTASGSFGAFNEYMVVDEDVFDALVPALAFLRADIRAIWGDTVSPEFLKKAFDNATGYAFPNSTFAADIKKVKGIAGLADTLEDILDGTGYAFPNSTINANMVAMMGDATAAARARYSAKAALYGNAVTGTLAVNTFTSTLTGLATNAIVGRYLFWVSGTLEGQPGLISAYNSSLGQITVSSNFSQAPGNGDIFTIA